MFLPQIFKILLYLGRNVSSLQVLVILSLIFQITIYITLARVICIPIFLVDVYRIVCRDNLAVLKVCRIFLCHLRIGLLSYFVKVCRIEFN